MPDDIVRFPVVEDDIRGVEGFQSVKKVQNELRHLLGRKSPRREQPSQSRPLAMRSGKPRMVGPAPEVRESRDVRMVEGEKRSLETSDPFFSDIPIKAYDKWQASIIVGEESLPIVCF